MTIDAPWTPYALSVSVPLLVLFIGALLATHHERPANRMLALALVAVLLLQGVLCAQITGWVDRMPYLLRSAFILHAAIATFLYLYVREFTDHSYRSRSESRWVFAPIGFAVAWYTTIAIFFHESAYWTRSPSYLWERWTQTWVLVGVYVYFLRRSFNAVQAFERRIRDRNSSLEGLSLRWLRVLLYACVALVLGGIVDVALGPSVTLWGEAVVFWATFACLLAYFTLRHSPTVGRAQLDAEADPAPVELPSAELRARGDELLSKLESQALYRKNDLRLADLADTLALRPSQVTDILSRCLGTTFYDLVNRMRVEDAKRRLLDPASAHLNILGIAMDSGFQSKSTFNEQFKKFAGMTPSEYRRRVSAPSEA